ncbi:alpha/beta hydrolase [Photobacterium sanctipauli]|uniref:Alpha/beta hydrolase n=2 Tax=Photobacterium sanctipauli TaxID=1342794 RepID=A0A2T3NRI0_9GAMM|nr:alpha/beta hydrolase [Photobacterium sanctipauli]
MQQIRFQLSELNLDGLCSLSMPQPVSAVTPIAELPADKPILLMLHGWQDNAESFSPLFPLLAEHFHLVAFDWPGHGWSDPRASGNYYHFVDYVDDLHQVVSLLPNRPLFILGHSLGALVSVCYSAAFGERVAGLVLIEGLAPLHEAESKAPARLRQGLLSRHRYRERETQRQQRSMASFEQALALRCNVNQLTQEQLTPLVARATYQQGGRWYWRHDNRLRCDSLYRMAATHASAMVGSVACPVLSIIGSQGYRQLKSVQLASAGWQNIIQHEVHGGHHCHLESPCDVAKQILLFSSQINEMT